jgi:pimeloyl-ACP methyl ester carboxylesterase
MSNSSIPTATVRESWAEVRAGRLVMRYRRRGVGRIVLVIHSPGSRDPLWPELIDALGASFRLVVPDPPASDADAGWLEAFLEGLGIPELHVVAADRFCMPALELALLGADQVARMVLIPEGGGREAALRGMVETATRQARVQLLVVRRGQPPGELLALVKDFLEGGGPPAVA